MQFGEENIYKPNGVFPEGFFLVFQKEEDMGIPKPVIWVFAIFLIFGCVLLILTAPVVSPTAAITNRYVLNNVESIKIVGVFEIRHITTSDEALMVIKKMVDDNAGDKKKYAAMQELYNTMEKTRDMILVRYVFTDGSGRCNPSDCGFIVYYPELTPDEYGCGRPATARINVSALNPTIPAMEGGVKTKILYYYNIRMIGENGCEVGPPFPFEEEHEFNFLTDVLGQAKEKIQAIPKCELGVYSGGKYSVTDCFGAQYYTQQTLVGIGPVPNEGQASLFFVAQTNTNLALYNINDIATMISVEPNTTQLMVNISLMFQDAAVISQENLRTIESALRSAEANLVIGP